MNIATVIGFLKEHKAAILSLGAVPAAFFAFKKFSGYKSQATDEIPEVVEAVPENLPAESSSARRRMTTARKNRIIGDIRRILLEQIPGDVTVTFGQSEKQGYRGYYLRKDDKDWLFLCWSDLLEDTYDSSTFWVELSESLTGEFTVRKLKLDYDIYTHPVYPKRIVISIPDGDMRNVRSAAQKVSDLVSKVFASG